MEMERELNPLYHLYFVLDFLSGFQLSFGSLLVLFLCRVFIQNNHFIFPVHFVRKRERGVQLIV